MTATTDIYLHDQCEQWDPPLMTETEAIGNGYGRVSAVSREDIFVALPVAEAEMSM